MTNQQMAMNADQLARIEAELKVLLDNQKRLNENISQLCERRDQLKIELNRDNLESIEWLIKNPAEPGAYEAFKKKFTELYGGEYEGIHSMGYHHDDDYQPIQKNFEFTLRVYGKFSDVEPSRDRFYKNIKHFLDNYLQFLSPVQQIEAIGTNNVISVVPFNFRSLESHLDFAGYEPTNKEWYWYTMRYGRTDTVKKFNSFDEAFNVMFTLVNYSDEEG